MRAGHCEPTEASNPRLHTLLRRKHPSEAAPPSTNPIPNKQDGPAPGPLHAADRRLRRAPHQELVGKPSLSMGLEGTAAISKLPTKAAPRRAAPVSTATRPPSPTLPSPGRAAANARARRHTQHQAQEAQPQDARGAAPGPRGAAPGARVGRDLPHLHAGGTGRRDAHVRVGRRLRV